MIPTILKSYQRQDGRTATVYDAPLMPAGLYTASGTGDVFEMGELTTLRLLLDVQANAGTNPELIVTIQTSPTPDPASTEWARLGEFAPKHAAGESERQVFPGADRYVRAIWTITGTATPTFRSSVSGEAAG